MPSNLTHALREAHKRWFNVCPAHVQGVRPNFKACLYKRCYMHLLESIFCSIRKGLMQASTNRVGSLSPSTGERRPTPGRPSTHSAEARERKMRSTLPGRTSGWLISWRCVSSPHSNSQMPLFFRNASAAALLSQAQAVSTMTWTSAMHQPFLRDARAAAHLSPVPAVTAPFDNKHLPGVL